MSKVLRFISTNPITFAIANLFLYVFYGLLIGISLIPSTFFVIYFYQAYFFESQILNICVFAMSIGVGVYLFFIVGILIIGTTARLLSLGFKPGKYKTDDPIFIRWLIYAGVHSICLSLILPYVTGSDLIKLYFRILGCKIGKNVFINTVGLHDSYLLEIGDNVVIGGKTDITCHIFEGDHLILEKTKIGSNVMIGANTYIMPGVTVGGNSDIGANSLVRKNKVIEEQSLIMPLPALPAKQVAKIMNQYKEKGKAAPKAKDVVAAAESESMSTPFSG